MRSVWISAVLLATRTFADVTLYGIAATNGATPTFSTLSATKTLSDGFTQYAGIVSQTYGPQYVNFDQNESVERFYSTLHRGDVQGTCTFGSESGGCVNVYNLSPLINTISTTTVTGAVVPIYTIKDSATPTSRRLSGDATSTGSSPNAALSLNRVDSMATAMITAVLLARMILC